jgi:hypothetical protein
MADRTGREGQYQLENSRSGSIWPLRLVTGGWPRADHAYRRTPAGDAGRSLSLNVRQVQKVSRLLRADLARRAPLLPGRGTMAFLDIDSMQKRVYGHCRLPAVARNGLMPRGCFGLLALVFDLPGIFLALVLDCLSVTLSLLCHAHNGLLSTPGRPTPLRRAVFSEKAP